MDEKDRLAEQFEANRPRLLAVAYRMLGSLAEAEDAVQECWLRLNRSDANDVESLGGWLTTVVARICLDLLRSRRLRREEPLGAQTPEPVEGRAGGIDPGREARMADSVGLALLVVLQALAPAERVAFVLHDLFGLPFDEIAPIVGRTPVAARQLASRARRRVRGPARIPAADLAAQGRVVDAFLAASRDGDFAALLSVLDPEVVFRADPAAVRAGASGEARGADTVAKFFLGRATGTRPALVDGALGLVVAPRGRLFLVLRLAISGGKIVEIEAVADRGRLRGIELAAIAQ